MKKCSECKSIRLEFKEGKRPISQRMFGDEDKIVECTTCKLKHHQYENDVGENLYFTTRTTKLIMPQLKGGV